MVDPVTVATATLTDGGSATVTELPTTNGKGYTVSLGLTTPYGSFSGKFSLVSDYTTAPTVSLAVGDAATAIVTVNTNSESQALVASPNGENYTLPPLFEKNIQSIASTAADGSLVWTSEFDSSIPNVVGKQIENETINAINFNYMSKTEQYHINYIGPEDFFDLTVTYGSGEVFTISDGSTLSQQFSANNYQFTFKTAKDGTITEVDGYDPANGTHFTYGYNAVLGQVAQETTNSAGGKEFDYIDGNSMFNQDIYYANPVNGVSELHITYNPNLSGPSLGGKTIAAFAPNGSETSITTIKADGERSVETFVTGQTYDIQVTNYNPDGHVVELERYFSNSSVVMMDTKYQNSGAYITNYYNRSSGQLSEVDTVAADGSKTVMLNTYALPTDTIPQSNELFNIDSNGKILTSSISSAMGASQVQTAYVQGQTLNISSTASTQAYGSNAGTDTFVFGPKFSAATIFNFITSGTNRDVISLPKSVSSDFQSILSHANGSTINFGGGEVITLHGIAISSLTASDFHFV